MNLMQLKLLVTVLRERYKPGLVDDTYTDCRSHPLALHAKMSTLPFKRRYQIELFLLCQTAANLGDLGWASYQLGRFGFERSTSDERRVLACGLNRNINHPDYLSTSDRSCSSA